MRTQDANIVCADWGFDYLKYDWCSYDGVARDTYPDDCRQPAKTHTPKMADALLNTQSIGTSCLLPSASTAMGDVWEGWGEASPAATCWRTTGDINDSWGSLHGIYRAFPSLKSGTKSTPDRATGTIPTCSKSATAA